MDFDTHDLPPLAWGMWRFGGDDLPQADRRVRAALDHGLTLLDTAGVYGPDNGDRFGAAEALLGRVLAADPSLRARMTLATKGGIRPGVPYDSAAASLVAEAEDSLRRLRTDRLDLYQVHRPDLLTHPAELAQTLARLVRSGKTLAVGVSNYSPAQVEALQAHLPFKLASVQPELSPLALSPLDDGVLDQAMRLGLRVLAWSPLGGGRLLAPGTPREAAVAEALDRIAKARGVSRTVAALAWTMTHPARPIPIVGSQRPERIAEAAGAAALRLTRTEWYAVLAASRQGPLPYRRAAARSRGSRRCATTTTSFLASRTRLCRAASSIAGTSRWPRRRPVTTRSCCRRATSWGSTPPPSPQGSRR